MSSAPERIKFTDLAVVLRPSIKVQKSDYLPDGLLPVVDQGAGLIGGFTNDMCARFPSPEPVIVFGDHTCRFKYVPFPFAVGADGTQVFRGVDGIDTRYLYFACLTLGLEHFGYQRHMKHLKVAEVPVWPLPTQQRIAAILSAYDDLIENNTRRIAILEEMARRLYEEWFVHFRFPGHEAAEFDGDGDDRHPVGWELGLLSDFIELKYGKALKASERVEGLVPVYGSSGVVGFHNERLVDGPGIIVGRKGNVGSVFWSEGPFYPIDTVYFVQTSLPLEYVYFNLQSQNFLNNDAAVPGLNRQQAYSLPFLRPPNDLLRRFVSFCQPLFSGHRLLHGKNANLRAQRDLLLPKLVSGEIDVTAAEAEMEAAE